VIDSNKLYVGPKLSLSAVVYRRRTTTTAQPSDGEKEESGRLSTGGTSPLVKMLMDPLHRLYPDCFFFFGVPDIHTPLDRILIFQKKKKKEIKGKRKCLERINKSIKGVNSRLLKIQEKKKILFEKSRSLFRLFGLGSFPFT
jgi:hypothetical protein